MDLSSHRDSDSAILRREISPRSCEPDFASLGLDVSRKRPPCWKTGQNYSNTSSVVKPFSSTPIGNSSGCIDFVLPDRNFGFCPWATTCPFTIPCCPSFLVTPEPFPRHTPPNLNNSLDAEKEERTVRVAGNNLEGESCLVERNTGKRSQTNVGNGGKV